MSEERVVISPSGTDAKITDEMRAASNARAERKAKIARVLNMGYLNDRLAVELPDTVHGEWVRNDPMEIQRKIGLGFEVDTKFAAGKALHSDGAGKPIVGDLIFMVTSAENFSIIEEVRRERYAEMHSRKNIENAEFRDKVKAAGKDMTLIDESVTRAFKPSPTE